jgi:hypothetical protein
MLLTNLGWTGFSLGCLHVDDVNCPPTLRDPQSFPSTLHRRCEHPWQEADDAVPSEKLRAFPEPLKSSRTSIDALHSISPARRAMHAYSLSHSKRGVLWILPEW